MCEPIQDQLPREFPYPWIEMEVDAAELWGGPCSKCGMVKSCTGDLSCECGEDG